MTSAKTRVLALHGFTGSPESFAELSRESPYLELVCPTLSGHGPNPDVSANTFGGELSRIAAWVYDRELAPLPVLGYSLGARVALGLCIGYPDLFTSAVLIGVNPGISDASELEARERWERELFTL